MGSYAKKAGFRIVHNVRWSSLLSWSQVDAYRLSHSHRNVDAGIEEDCTCAVASWITITLFQSSSEFTDLLLFICSFSMLKWGD